MQLCSGMTGRRVREGHHAKNKSDLYGGSGAVSSCGRNDGVLLIKTNRSLERGLSVLLYVCQSERTLGLTEISRGTGLDKATTQRFLATLVNADMIRFDAATRRYDAGPGIHNFWPGKIRKLCRPHLQRLMQALQETICLIVPQGKKRVCLDAIEPDRELRIVAPIGREMPVYFGASGRVLMAFRPTEQVERVLCGPEPASSSIESMPSTEVYLDQLAKVRAEGYAYNAGEVAADTSTIAAPVFDGSGNAAAAIVVRGPRSRMKNQDVNELARLVMASAEEVSKEIINLNA